jgi:hypothetical protein
MLAYAQEWNVTEFDVQELRQLCESPRQASPHSANKAPPSPPRIKQQHREAKRRHAWDRRTRAAHLIASDAVLSDVYVSNVFDV